MPHEFLNKSISRILFISASCTAIILLLWLHPLCHLSPSVPFTGQHQIFIASLFFNKLSTPIPQPFPPHSIQVISIYKWKGTVFMVISLLRPSKLFAFCNTLISILIPSLLCIVILYVAFFLPSVPSVAPSHAFVPNPPPPPLCMLKYSVNDGSRGGSGGERVAGRGGIGGGGGGSIDVKSAAVVIIFCSLFLGTSGPLRATVSSTVFTGS